MGTHASLEVRRVHFLSLGTGRGKLQLGTFFGRQEMSVLKSFLRDESGATAIEYGLIAAGISVAIIVTVQSLGSKLANTFTNIDNKLN